MAGIKNLDFRGAKPEIDGEPGTPKPPTAPELVEIAPGRTKSAADFGRPTQASIDMAKNSHFPSRQPRRQRVQINLYLDEEIGERFKAYCQKERYSYGEVLTFLFEEFERKK